MSVILGPSSRSRLTVLSVLSLVVLSFGCASTRKTTHRFEPQPRPKVGSQDLQPVSPPSTTDLLNRANEAFRRANEAEEKGDHEGALRSYHLMLELLIEADLDPSVLYSLRSEFEHILDTGAEHAALFDRTRDRDWAGLPPVAGDVKIPFPIPQRVISEIEEIQQLYPRNFQAGLNRSYKYVPAARKQFARAGLPQDLVWLAMVESQFHPKVVSPAGAAGMWQFMRATGSRYDLHVDGYVDERLNWQKATAAATAYLTDLRDMFGGDWALALSAYNMGEAGLVRAIASTGGERDLWTLIETPPASDIMRLETKKFFPKFLASIIVARNPEKYGFSVEPQPPDKVIHVPVNGCYSLASLDKASELPEGTLENLNPDLIRGVTPPTGEYKVAVPLEARTAFIAALKQTSKEPSWNLLAARMAGQRTHVVKRGETLGKIAQKYGVALKDLLSCNKLRSANRVAEGNRIIIPGGSPHDPTQNKPAETEAPAPDATPSEDLANAETKTYEVRPGDTLGAIATAARVPLKDLLDWNGLDRDATLHPGQVLKLASVSSPADEAEAASADPAPAEKPDPPADTPQGAKREHVVKPGECPAVIAKNYSVPLDDLLKWNKLTQDSTIVVGRKLAVYGPAKAVPAPDKTHKSENAQEPDTAQRVAKNDPDPPAARPAAKPAQPADSAKTHKVARGDSPASITRKYNISLDDFLAWNNLSRKSLIILGKEYVVTKPDASTASKKSAGKKADSSKGKKIVHEVGKNQNPTTIARKYGVKVNQLFEWNGWKKEPVLHVGDTVTVYTK